MAEAIQLARRGLYTVTPNPCVGCVLVKDEKIVGRGWHIKAGDAHAEVNAIADAGDHAKGATAYISLEPCSFTGKTGACTNALQAAGIVRVVSAMEDPNPKVSGQGNALLREAGLDDTQIDFYQFPTIADVPQGEDAPTDTFHIPANASNKDNARAFLQFVTSADVRRV